VDMENPAVFGFCSAIVFPSGINYLTFSLKNMMCYRGGKVRGLEYICGI